MKKITFIFTMIIILILSGCRHEEEYNFLNSENDVVSISIVAIFFTDEGEVIQTERVSIEDKEDFMDAFQNLTCYTYYGDPVGICDIGTEANVIKILYENEEYELINWCGQSKYSIENGLRFYSTQK